MQKLRPGLQGAVHPECLALPACERVGPTREGAARVVAWSEGVHSASPSRSVEDPIRDNSGENNYSTCLDNKARHAALGGEKRRNARRSGTAARVG
eukprot:CAMPEP_0198500530 /NCGR_PEP_ID=MMETSP1462-20131121/8212_1 /TAXON_ID=1333877 /ORGANISM="Brandtodinium nutriculum, Strain RCC3387" /LENGTH=95 /DNA_ID=CAMNT_0044229539 /DNA_START=7 /DNA_END=292 /DNA_ORIENTATION=-